MLLLFLWRKDLEDNKFVRYLIVCFYGDMLIINHTSGGRMGNILMQHLHLAASTIEYGWKIWDVAFHVKRKFQFQSLPHLKVRSITCLVWFLCRLSLIRCCIDLLNCIGIKFIRNSACKPSEMPELLKEQSRSSFSIILNCWPYTDYRSLYLHQNKLRKYIKPENKYLVEASEWIKAIREPESILVGVHVRRTDYENHYDGKHFFEMDVYKKIMMEIQEKSSQKVQFVICSDEKICKDAFVPEVDNINISYHSYMTDFSILSMCDYIVGPPSTFASTASFLGNVKRFTLYEKDANIRSLDDFGISMIDYDDVHIWREKRQLCRFHVKLSEGEIVSCSQVCNYKNI